MTPADMAHLHSQEPTGQRAWSEAEFTALLSEKNALSVISDSGFALGRTTLDEAELFLIMTKPSHRNQGIGRRILRTFEEQAREHALQRVILEVADTNTAAKALYISNGYQKIAIRKNYYTFPNGSHADAIVMEKHLSNIAENTE